MVDHMKAVAQQPQELSVEERNLLSVAYKNVIGSRRASWRVITSIEQKGEQERLPLIREYKAKIEDELLEICNDILSIIETELIPNSTSEEGKVFYFKMKGDYHRYLAEFQVGEKRRESSDAALTAYKCATDIAEHDLPPTHPIRLGLALNFSVFFYEIYNSPVGGWLAGWGVSQEGEARVGSLSHTLRLLAAAPCRWAGSCMCAGQEGLRRRHRRAGHAVRGVVQGQHPHHAAS